MSDDGGGGFRRFIRSRLRAAGRQYAEARRAYGAGKAAVQSDLPTDDDGRVRIVCRRYAEQRTVALDAEARPTCFDPAHQDCQGCVEDIRDGRVETW